MDFWKIINLTENVLDGIELRNYFEAVSEEITCPIEIQSNESLTFGCRSKTDNASRIELKTAITNKGFTIGKQGMSDVVIIEECIEPSGD